MQRQWFDWWREYPSNLWIWLKPTIMHIRKPLKYFTPEVTEFWTRPEKAGQRALSRLILITEGRYRKRNPLKFTLGVMNPQEYPVILKCSLDDIFSDLRDSTLTSRQMLSSASVLIFHNMLPLKLKLFCTHFMVYEEAMVPAGPLVLHWLWKSSSSTE